MPYSQVDLFAKAPRARQVTSPEVLARVQQRLEATLARLEGERAFCWKNELGAIHEENSFKAASKLLGAKGEALWARFDAEMDRLYATTATE